MLDESYDRIEGYTKIGVLARDVQEGDIWLITTAKARYHVNGSYKDPRPDKPFWVLEGVENRRRVESIHSPTQTLTVLRPVEDDEDEAGELLCSQ